MDAMDTTPRHVPRRTYGRAAPRQVSPDLDDDSTRMTTAALFLPASTSTTAPHTSAMIGDSPSKTLLKRFGDASVSWRESLSGIDVISTKDDVAAPSEKTKRDTTYLMARTDDDAPESDDMDEEEIRQAMERMRKQQRGELPPSSDREFEKNDRVEAVKVNAGRSLNAFSSSTLSAVPTSPLRSSPPLQKEPVHEEETIPVRKSGTRPSGRAKRIITSDDEDDNDDAAVDPEENDESDGASSETSKAGSRLFSRSPTATSNSDPRVKDYFSKLADEDDDAETEPEGEKNMARSMESIADPVTLFDEDDESGEQRQKLSAKPKGLNKKDQVELQKDIARALREKPIAVVKPEHTRRNMTDWLKIAQGLMDADGRTPENPGLSRDDKSPATSPTTLTPADEIAQFTPSSAANARAKLKSSIHANSVPGNGQASSSPTPPSRVVNSRTDVVVPPTSEEDFEDEQYMSIQEMIAAANEKDRKALQLAEQRRLLEARKAAALQSRSKLPLVKASAEQFANKIQDDDEDFIIVPDEARVKAPIAQAPIKGPINAATMLRNHTAAPAITKNRQAYAQRAGKVMPKAGTSTETYVDFAAKTFAHHGTKDKNGGARPSGQKKGREVAMNQAQLDAFIFNQHLKQVKDVAAKKEMQYGKGRTLPCKQALELTITSSGNEGEANVDEDEDDGEFALEDDEESAIAYSGASEDEGDAQDDEEDDEEAAVEAEDDEEKENVPPVVSSTSADDDEEETVAFIKRRARPSARVAFDSDDEEAPPAKAKSSSQPFAGLNSESVTTKAVKSTPLDLSGFDDGSQGFSQLFGETQAGFGDDNGGFDAMRADEPNGLIPGFALLPEVNISKTQVERDNALIAGEVEMARAELMETDAAPKKQYLNSQGFFTQTRPNDMDATQMTDDEEISASSRRGFSTIIGLPLVKESTATDVDPTMSPEMTAAQTLRNETLPSPTQDSQVYSRLKRRTSPALQFSPTQAGSSGAAEAAPNAFDLLRLGQRRAERKQKRPFNSELVDEQAEESDEDNAWGITGGDEDDEGEDEGYVPDLLNDEEVSEEERKRLAELAAEKHREIQAADDAKREAEAKKLTEGAYRNRRKGNAFLSDDEDEDEEGRRRRLSKKQRRARKLDREDGLNKLEGEENAFRRTYDEDLESDNEFEETPLSPGFARSPSPDYMTGRERHEMLRERARMNNEMDIDMQERVLEQHIGQDSRVVEQFSISRTVRTTTSFTQSNIENVYAHRQGSTTSVRSTESFAKFITDESQNPRRSGAVGGGVSVVGHGTSSRSASASGLGGKSAMTMAVGAKVGGKTGAGKPVERQASILMTKKSGFM